MIFFFAEEENAIDDNTRSFSNSLFKTGSGRKVTISPNGLVRAKTLLGLLNEDLQFKTPHRDAATTVDDETPPYLQLHNNKVMESSYKMTMMNGFFENNNKVLQPSDIVLGSAGCVGVGVAAKQAPIKFSTAGGRSISISSDALQRARSLLGDPDLGDFFDDATSRGACGDSVFSFPNKRQACETSDCSNNTPNTPLVQQQVTPQSNHRANGFTCPLLPSRQMEFSTKFLCEGSNGNNLIMKFDDVGNERDCYSRKSKNTGGGQKPLLHDRKEVPEDSTACRSSLNGFSSRKDSRGVPLGRPLADITNAINTVHTNNRQPASGKRRLGLRATVSPFKRPRGSKISSALVDQDVENFPNGKHRLRAFSTIPFTFISCKI